MCWKVSVLPRHRSSSRSGPAASTLAAVGIFLTLLLVAPFASAQFAIGANIEWTGEADRATQYKYWISKANCLDKEKFTFPITGATVADNIFELWVSTEGGADCLDSSQRTAGSTQKCYKVDNDKEGAVSAVTFNVNVTADQIANVITGVSSCTDSNNNDTPRPITLWFLQYKQGENPVTTSATFTKINVDLVGPKPPAIKSVSGGDGELVVNVGAADSSTSKNTKEYRLYCDPPGTGSGDDSSGCDCGAAGLTGGSGGTSTTTTTTVSPPPPPAAGAAGSAGGGTGGAGGSGGTGGTSGSSGSGTGGTPSGCEPSKQDCSSCAFAAGEDPPEDDSYLCGSSTSAGNITATGLANGTVVAVAAAAVDEVGNVSQLSTLDCEAPVESVDFYESYKSQGGKADGTCAVRPRPAKNNWFAPLGASILVMALAGRRLARRKTGPRSSRGAQ